MPEVRNQQRNPIERLLDTEEKGGGLALFGWAGVAVFCLLAAFASWQFAPGRAALRLARVDDSASADIITGGIKPVTRTVNTRVPTVPTPLPDDQGISKGDLDQLRADMKDLRRVVGRIDVSTDVLARRISNLEDSVGSGQTAAAKPIPQSMAPITSSVTAPVANAPAVPSQVSPAAAPPAAALAASVPLAAPPVAPPPRQVSASTPPPMPLPARAPVTGLPHPLPADQPGDRSAVANTTADRDALARMLLQRGQGLESDSEADGANAMPPLPDPVSVIPKTRPILTMPPQPFPAQAPQPPGAQVSVPPPVVKSEAKPSADAATTGSVAPRPILPIDPTKAVVVKPAGPDAAKPVPAKPDMPVAGAPPAKPTTPPDAAMAMTAEESKKASEAMQLAMRDAQPAAIKPAEPLGIDLGGYKSIGQVKKVWSDLELRQGKLTTQLTPLARLSEASDGVEIRLVAGPFTDREQAIRTCRQLRGATAKCDPVAFAGETILTKPTVVEHRPPPTMPEAAKPVDKFQIKKLPPLDLPSKPLLPVLKTP